MTIFIKLVLNDGKFKRFKTEKKELEKKWKRKVSWEDYFLWVLYGCFKNKNGTTKI